MQLCDRNLPPYLIAIRLSATSLGVDSHTPLQGLDISKTAIIAFNSSLLLNFVFIWNGRIFFPFRYNSTWSSPTTARIFTTIPTWEKLKLVHVGFFPVAAGSHIQWEGKSTPKMKSRKGDGSKRQTADCEVTAQVKGAEIHKLEKLESVCLV